jgi:hypothetical protein
LRTISFLLAFVFSLGGSSIAGSTDSLPGIGSFSYSGSPGTTSAPFAVALN